MGKRTPKCYYKKSSSSSCNKCSSCSSSSSTEKCKKCCCSSSCSTSSAFTIDECQKAVAKGNYHARKCSCSSSSSSDDDTLCKSTSVTCNPCRYDISKKDCCPSSSSSCCSRSSCCSSSSSDCYSSSSSSCSSSSSSSSCDFYFLINQKPIKTEVCKDGVKCKAYKWKYGRGNCVHNKPYGQCKYQCRPCCTKQYNKKKYKYNDYDAVKCGKYDKKFGKLYCSSSSSSSSECPGCPVPTCKKKGHKLVVVKNDNKVVVAKGGGGGCAKGGCGKKK